MTDEHGYFAGQARAWQVRTPELTMWIECLSIALLDARSLAEGQPLDTASKQKRRLRWQLAWELNNMHEWMAASDEGGLQWIASVFEACLGSEAFDMVAYERQIRLLLSKAEARILAMTQEVARSAVERPKAVPRPAMPRQDARGSRVLSFAPRSRAKALASARQRERWAAMAKKAGGDPAQGRVSVPMRRMRA